MTRLQGERENGPAHLDGGRASSLWVLNRGSLVGAPVDRSGLTVLNFFVQKLVSIRVVYPSATHPLEPRINQNLRTDRPEVLTKYGLWGSSIKYGYETF